MAVRLRRRFQSHGLLGTRLAQEVGQIMPPHGPGMFGAAHSHDPEYPDDNWNLYSMLDQEGLMGLNVTNHADVVGIFRPFVLRLQETPRIESDADEEMMVVCRFTSPVHIRKLMVIGGGDEGNHPMTMKCYVNKEDIDFTNIEDFKADQVFDNLQINSAGTNELITTLRPFTNVNVLVLYFAGNHGDDSTIVRYIGMQGEHTHYRREAVDATYEVLCNGQDIQQPEDGAKGNLKMGEGGF